MPSTSNVSLREIHGEPDAMAALQRVLEAAPGYAQLVTGGPPGPSDAQSTYTMLPPDMSYDDKFVFAIHRDGQCIGCIDLIRGYPVPDTAMVGLLLVAEPFQRKGVGSAAYALLEARIRAWGSCKRVRIGVVETNREVMPFWRGLGFAPTGEAKPYRHASVISRIIVLERELAGVA